MAREHHSFVYAAATRLLVRHLSEHALARVRLCLLGGCVGAQLLGLPLQALLLGAHPLQGLPNLQGVWVGFGFGSVQFGWCRASYAHQEPQPAAGLRSEGVTK